MLDQVAENAVLDLSTMAQEISHGSLDLKGSVAAIASLRSACGPSAEGSASPEAPEAMVYAGGAIKRQIEYRIVEDAADWWDARVTVDGDTSNAMTAYVYFGQAAPPQGFVVASLAEERSEFLVFRNGA